MAGMPCRSKYAHPEALVETDGVTQYHTQGEFKLVEIDVDTEVCAQGYIFGVLGFH
jgi:hypothetical protein